MPSSLSRFARTDLAAESTAFSPPGGQGYRYTEHISFGTAIARLHIFAPEAAALLGRPMGRYVTLRFHDICLLTKQEKQAFAQAVAAELFRLCNCAVPAFSDVLVVGLGNRAVTADAIGPGVADRISVTAHLSPEDCISCRRIAAIAPGVSHRTGIESAHLIKAAAEILRPQLILCVDALAARSVERLSNTVQLSDTGIHPGSGVQNSRPAIDQATVGVPVIAIGVPTVVDSATLICDALEQAGIHELFPSLEPVLEEGRSFFVSPKETDLVTQEMSAVLARAIDLAMAMPRT